MTTATSISVEHLQSLGPSRGKRFAIRAMGAAAVVLLVAAALIVMLGRGPAYYRQVDALSDAERTAAARQFIQQSSAVFNQMENESAWSCAFRASHMNAWLAGDFERKHAELLPRGVSDPRLSFENGRVALAFQLRRGPVTTIISAGGRVWLPETNLVAIELDSVRAGVIPIPAGYVIRTLSAAAKSAALDLEWKQHDHRPVALVRLGSPDQGAAIRVDAVAIKYDTLQLAGRSRGHGDWAGPRAPDAGSSDVSWNVHTLDSPQRK